MNRHFCKSRILIAVVIGLFSLMLVAETMPTSSDSTHRQTAAAQGTNESNGVIPAGATGAESAAGVKSAESNSDLTVREYAAQKPEKRKKKFPWLLVAATLVVGAVIFYFVVLNKKYTLTTTMGTGVNGTPVSGSMKYKNGSTVNYDYSAASGYTNLVVTLDGAAVAANGTVKMDKNHALSATATQSFVLAVAKYMGVNGTPDTGMYTYASGTVINYNYVLASNYIDLVVKLDDAAVAASGTFVMNGNHALTANATYNDPNVTYTLVVQFWNSNATGSPAPGTYHYANGTIVNYDYYGTASYPYVSVYIDMVDTCFQKLPTHCTGTILMNKDRSVGVQGGL
jgi:flagellar basal body-associated protein FliL